jgi:L-lactate dehydrogenase
MTGDIVKYAPNATYILVSNPVDVLTYVFCKYSGLPESRVIGSCTILDTSRLRARLSEIYDINQQNVHAYVLGVHGDSYFIPWSLANISNVPVLEYSKAIVHPMPNMPALDLAAIEDYVRKSGSIIIQRKGATYYAVSVAVCHICKSLLSGVDTTLTVSTMLHGEYGIDDVCLSLLNVVGHKGAYNKILLPLNDKEIADLHYSANNLKAVIKSLSL